MEKKFNDLKDVFAIMHSNGNVRKITDNDSLRETKTRIIHKNKEGLETRYLLNGEQYTTRKYSSGLSQLITLQEYVDHVKDNDLASRIEALEDDINDLQTELEDLRKHKARIDKFIEENDNV